MLASPIPSPASTPGAWLVCERSVQWQKPTATLRREVTSACTTDTKTGALPKSPKKSTDKAAHRQYCRLNRRDKRARLKIHSRTKKPASQQGRSRALAEISRLHC